MGDDDQSRLLAIFGRVGEACMSLSAAAEQLSASSENTLDSMYAQQGETTQVATAAAMQHPPAWAWLGAAICQDSFEIGAEVKQEFCAKYPELDSAFKAGVQEGKFYADLYAIARYILQRQGVQTVLGGDQCSYRQPEEYFSYRRASKTGRMAAFVFMA